MSAPELLPCPFCGNSTVYVRFVMQEADVFCPDCETNGPVYENDAEAIAAWNTRADLSTAHEAAARREGWNAAIEAAAKVAEEQAEWVPIKQGDMSKAILAMKETDQ